MLLRSERPVFLRTLILLNAVGFAEKKEKEAAALIERAERQSDIRAEGAPAFRLRSSFAITRDDGTRIEGTYTETWVSSKLWRREVVTSDFRRTIVGRGVKSWQLDTSEPPKGSVRSNTERALTCPVNGSQAIGNPGQSRTTQVVQGKSGALKKAWTKGRTFRAMLR